MKEKRLDYEALRLIAIFGVVFNHTQLRGFSLYQLDNCSSVNFTGSLLLGILCKTAVPLFFLVSGGLLLHKDEPIRVVLKKRVLRIGIVLVLFSTILYLFWSHWGYIEAPGLRDYLTRLWSTGVSVPYWYLYAYLGLMLMLPLLRPMVRVMSNMTFAYLFGIHVVLYCILSPIAVALDLGPANRDLLICLVEPNVFYFLMGYYLAHRFDWSLIKKRHTAILWGFAAAAVLTMYLLARLGFQRGGTVGFDYHESLILFPIAAIYASVHELFAHHTAPAWLRRLLTELGGCVFGTYLLEGILRHYLGFIFEALEPRLHVLPACLIWVAAVVACGLAITWVLKKIPGLKKLL